MVVDFHWIKTVCAVTAVLFFLHAAWGKRGYLFILESSSIFFFNFSTPLALVGLIGAHLEKASWVFLFALFYLIGFIVCYISAIVAYGTWNLEHLNGGFAFWIGIVLVVYSLSSCSLTILTC